MNIVSATTPSAFRPVGPCLVRSDSETNEILRACQLIRSQRKNAAGSRSGNCCQRAALCLHLDQFQHLHLSPSTMSSQFEKAVAYVQGLDKQGSGPDATVKLEASHHYVEDRRRAILIDTLIHSFINSTSKVLVLSLWKNLN